ncbi:MAG: hypothetical protein ABFD91_02885 [Anaerohalosphaeraceae bacterium]
MVKQYAFIFVLTLAVAVTALTTGFTKALHTQQVLNQAAMTDTTSIPKWLYCIDKEGVVLIVYPSTNAQLVNAKRWTSTSSMYRMTHREYLAYIAAHWLQDGEQSFQLQDLANLSRCWSVKNDNPTTENDQEPSELPTVWVTLAGMKFHKKGCYYVKNGFEIDLVTALSSGKEACRICWKEKE